MRKWSNDANVQERFEPMNAKLKKTLKAMPETQLIHDPAKPGSTDVVPYDLKAYAFLEEYKKDLDAERVLKMLEIPRKSYNEWLLQPKFTDVLNRIHKAYEDAVLMDGKTIAGWSVEILRDLHEAFKAGDSKAAMPLSSMAGNMLRASGNFKENTAKTPQVLIQINTTASPNVKQEPQVTTTQTSSDPKSESNININIKQSHERKNISDLPILRGTQQG